MKKINYISIEIRSNGENDIFTLNYDLMLETDRFMCLKHNEDLMLLTLEKDRFNIHSTLEDVSIYFKDWEFLKYKAIHCNLYSMKDPEKMLEIMKKKITRYIHKEYDWLFSKDIDNRINSLSLEAKK